MQYHIKTQEGLNATKEEVEGVNKKLEDDEIKDVTGGSTTENAPKELSCGNWIFTGFIGKYANSHIEN